jgi:CHAD domain-containing protein
VGSRTKRRNGDGETFAVAMRDLIGERWGAVWAAMPAALAGDDIEGVHDVRVASRRLRAAMDVATECFPGSWYRGIHRRAKDITGSLGAVRDLDVLSEWLAGERDAAPLVEQPGIQRLIDRVESDRAAARREMEEFVAAVVAQGVPAEAERRFGRKAAAPPGLAAAMAQGRADGGRT